ncbi:MAG: hypothetical protein M1833_004058 [Piccolia ochrophora]|nr:MAG: hypothetical protein M1833_004058 [Piccolia ochrophora]
MDDDDNLPAAHARDTSSSPTPLPPSTNTDGAALADSLRRMSLSAASSTALPPSPHRPVLSQASSRSYNAQAPAPVDSARTLRKSSSSLSLEQRPSHSRRSSSSAHPAQSSPFEPPPEVPAMPLPPTAASVASSFFGRELEDHLGQGIEGGAKPTVIIHDACYGHRYSRPRTSKTNLSTIVERPERIHASILGVAAAYVRLGERHAAGRNPPRPDKTAESKSDIPFRIYKSSRSVPLTSTVVTNVHGVKWMEELKIMCDTAEAKLALNGKELERPQEASGPTEHKVKLHEGDLYLCGESLNAMEGALGAVCDGVDKVFQKAGSGRGSSKAFVCIRPPGHHCASSHPSGFCWLNNVHVGVCHAAMVHNLTHAAIIDFDLHHGDGSQSITWAHNARVARLPKNASNLKRSSIGYFSIHDINSYPCEMGDEEKIRNASLCIENAHGQSIWNVHLQSWKTDAEFWELYESRYSILLDKARAFLRTHTQRLRSTPNQPPPKAAIFLSAGFDASEWEGAGMQRHKVNVPTNFYARFTQDVVRLSEEEGLGVEGRVISVLEGGYSDRALCSGVFSHLSALAGQGQSTAAEYDNENGLGLEMGARLNLLNGTAQKDDVSSTLLQSFDSNWWSVQRLEELEALVNPPPPPPAPKKPRNATPPTYTSSTQSSNAKIVGSPKVRRTISNSSMAAAPRSPSAASRPLSPPPEVDWATAAFELSKLLIPSNRQTRSCRPEELSAEASRAKKQRHSAIGLPSEEPQNDGKRMTLRDRKSRMPNYTVDEIKEDRPESRSDRRKTVAGPDVLAEKAAARGIGGVSDAFLPTGRARRRSSAASSVSSVGNEALLAARSSTQASNGVRETSKPKSSSSRPPSSKGIKQGVPPIARKVSTVASQARTGASKAQGIKREPSAPLMSTVSEHEDKSVNPAKTATDGALDSNKPMSQSEDTKKDDLDSLTSGMQRIKLNLPPKAEHDAREMKKKTETKKAVARPARKVTAPKPAKAAVKKKSGNIVPPNPTPPSADLPPSLPEATAAGRPAESAQAPAQDIRPSSSSFDIPSNTAPPPQPQSDFIPYAPPSSVVPQPLRQEAPLTWLPPNTATPPPAAKRGDLPVFTSSSPIPFARPSSARQETTSRTGTDIPMAEDPFRDATLTTSKADTTMPPPPPPAPTFTSAAAIPSAPPEERHVPHEGMDIWEVPDTPRR